MGQLGDGKSTISALTPKSIVLDTSLTGTKFTAISAGQTHSMAISETGVVYAWGENEVRFISHLLILRTDN